MAKRGKWPKKGNMAHRMLILAFARAANMVAATPRRLAIFWPTAASTQQSCRASTAEMRPAAMASLNLRGRSGNRAEHK